MASGLCIQPTCRLIWDGNVQNLINIDPHLWIIGALTVALHIAMRRVGALWAILLSLPSTVLHEFSHFIVALLLGGKPRGLSIIPRKQSLPDSRCRWILGSVTFYPTTISAAPTALAPLLYALVAWSAYQYGQSGILYKYGGAGLHWGIIVVMLLAGLPSREDFFVLIKNPTSTVLWGGAGFILLV